MKKKQKITNAEAFNLANILQADSIITIKDTEFALAVVRNFNMILEVYNELKQVQDPSDEWLNLITGIEKEEEIDALKNDPKNKDVFEAREKQVEEYNKLLDLPFEKNLIKIKIKNLNTKLSAKDIIALEPMINL